MKKIELAKLKSGHRHTVKVELTFESGNGAGDEKETMRVVYRGISLTESDEITRAFEQATDKREALIKALTENVLELPDLIDAGQGVQPTAEFWATLDTYYLNRINQAVLDDRQGNA